MSKSDLAKLKEYEREFALFNQASALLNWDKETIIPKKGHAARNEALSFFSQHLHSQMTDKHFVSLINKLHKQKLTGDNKVTVEKYYKQIQKQSKLSSEFVSELSKQQTKTYDAWLVARENNDLTLFTKQFKLLIGLIKKKTQLIDKSKHPYDVLLDDYEEGMDVKTLKELFSTLKPQLVDLLKRIKASKKYKSYKPIFEKKAYPVEEQTEALEKLYDLMIPDRERFVWGTTTHPFMTKISGDDIRITTAFRDSPLFSFGSSAHECGHALYELGFLEKHHGSILGEACSFGMHESQSRFWELQMIHSGLFWKAFYPTYKKIFPLLKGTTWQQFYEYANHVTGSLIRIEGDEVSYCLHIIIRFEMELDLLEGKLPVNKLEEVWNQKYKESFGRVPKNLKEGVLQDVHWSYGYIGYFPTYALGTIYAAMFYEQMKHDLPLDEYLSNLEFGPIRFWLGENIHKYGASKTAEDIIKRATHKTLSTDDYINYLEGKYSQLYNL